MRDTLGRFIKDHPLMCMRDSVSRKFVEKKHGDTHGCQGNSATDDDPGLGTEDNRSQIDRVRNQ